MAHDKYCVHVCLDQILTLLKENVHFEVVHIFSDGAASQFKQKYNFCNLTHISQGEE